MNRERVNRLRKPHNYNDYPIVFTASVEVFGHTALHEILVDPPTLNARLTRIVPT